MREQIARTGLQVRCSSKNVLKGPQTSGTGLRYSLAVALAFSKTLE